MNMEEEKCSDERCDELSWPRHRAQWTQQTMYTLRRLIRGAEVDVEAKVSAVEDSLGTDLKSVLDEALQSKAPEDGQNLLTYAAAQGKEAWFLHIASQIRSKLGIRKLVKELRGLDIDGAPLLFNAAASRGEHSCFGTAHDLIRKALGKGGLAEQLGALDGEGRGLQMFAARSNDCETFKKVLSICKKACEASMEKESSPYEGAAANTPAGHSWNVNILVCECGARKAAREAASAYALQKVLEKTDYMGMNCLHHAAEAGCADVLQAVIDERKSVNSTYRAAMERAARPQAPQMCKVQGCSGKNAVWLRSPPTMNFGQKDRKGRTPIMLVLRNTCGSYVDANGLEAKFRKLYPGTTVSCGVGESWMKSRRVFSVPVPVRCQRRKRGSTKMKKQDEKPEQHIVAITELLHAARGGQTSLELALNAVLRGFEDDDGLKRTVSLDRALGVMKEVDESNPAADVLPHEHESEAAKKRISWGRALLLAAAAKRGDTNMLRHVLAAIEEGQFSLTKTSTNDGKFSFDNALELTKPGENVRAAVKKIKESGESLFSYAVLSGNTDAVQLVHDLIVNLFGDRKKDIWNILSGNDNTASSLACAASAPMEADKHGLTMFDKVYALLKKQAVGKEMTNLLKWRRGLETKERISPLMGAAFCSNWVIFWTVYDAYKNEAGGDWWYESVWPSTLPRRTRQRAIGPVVELHECPDGIPRPVTRGAWTIPAVMWRDIAEALKDSKSPPNMLMSWREYLRAFSRRAVKVAAKRGTFTDVSNLVKEGFPLHDDYIYALLENIGDHEQDIIQTVLFAVANASNPFGMAAGVSRMLRRAEVDHPMYQRGLRRLQRIIDDFDEELLDKLPHTVRGMGMAILGGQRPILYGQGLEQGIIFRLGNLAGFIVVQWMLEPSLLVSEINEAKGYVGPEYEDPLRRALDRGSKALDFLNSPLVKNYLHVKFTGTLPPWTSRNPFQPTVNEGFFKYEFDKYKLTALPEGLDVPVPENNEVKKQSPAERERWWTMSFLLRFLQGWDHGEAALRWNIPKLLVNSTEQATSAKTPPDPKPQQKKIPHTTILPGLQFSLAGILGKPETFYEVPVIRFMFEIFSYLVMLELFCFSVLLREHDSIPPDEAVFYVFAVGLLWREVLEFRDGMPARRHRAADHQDDHSEEQEISNPRLSMRGPGRDLNRMVSAFTRYVFYDTWNFLDTSTILCILVAFVFRLLALSDKFFLFHAQFFYALSAPLLFSRLLVLSQIDATLGPMTQVIWRMMSQTLRFSAFIAMVMLSFALAFHAVFHTCGSYVDPDCDLRDDGEFLLQEAFGTFSDSFVTVFSLALGGPDFELFEEAGDDCSSCDLPKGARNAGRFLMVVYMVTMAVVLLNLLIAVLSTAHDKVYANAEKEFHLARAKLIFQSARVVARRRPPPPLNLAKVVLGVAVDTANELFRVFLHIRRLVPCVCRKGVTPEARLKTSKEYREKAEKFPPFSTRPQWKAIDGFLQRLAFAFTMGVAALAMSIILWLLSSPWVAWSIFRLIIPPEEDRKKKRENKKQEDGTNASDVSGSIRVEPEEGKVENSMKVPREVDRGYFYALASLVIRGSVGLTIGTVSGIALCLCYIIGSVALWAAGMVWLLSWLRKNWAKNVEDMPEAMPGQEHGDHWKNAWDLAKSRNHGFRVDCEHPHFNVLPFLKSKTGLSMQHLASLTKLHDEKSKSDEELVEVDHELADAPIDLKYLSRKVQKRRNARSVSGDDGGSGGDSGALGGKLMKAVETLKVLSRELVERDERRRDACRDAGESKGVDHVGSVRSDGDGDTANSGEPAPHS